MKFVQCIKSDNIEIMMGSEIDDINIELFDSLLQKYQEGLEKLMRESEFNFDSVNLSSKNKFEKRWIICRFS